MFNGTSGYSLSDIAAVSNGDGFGGGSAWWIIILFLFCFMGGNWNGRGELNQYATAASQQEILFGQQFQGLNSAINKIGDGLSSLGYSQLQQMNANTSSINGNVTSEGRALQMQLADCCCSNKEAISQVRYDAALNTQALLASNAEQTQKILDVISTNRIADMQNQINQLQLQAAMCGVMRYPQATTYTAGYAPMYTGCGCSN